MSRTQWLLQGVIHTTNRTQACLSRLASCLETLYFEGMHQADYWIIPVRNK
jgi:hypothetical protein